MNGTGQELDFVPAHKMALKACWARVVPIAFFLLLYMIVNGVFWTVYFSLTNASESISMEDLQNSMRIQMSGVKLFGTALYFVSTTTILLAVYYYTEQKVASLWACLKDVFKQWRLLLTTVLVSASLSILSYNIGFLLSETKFAQYTLSLGISIVRDIIFLIFLMVMISNRELTDQIQKLCTMPKSSWAKILASLLLLMIFSWGFSAIINNLKAATELGIPIAVKIYVVSYLGDLISTIVTVIVYLAILLQFGFKSDDVEG